MSDRDTFIKCGHCYEKVIKPMHLPCFHTVCSECVKNIVGLTAQNGHFECPICRREIDRDTSFQAKLYIDSSDSVFSISQMDCDACGARHSAIYECKQCNQTFCKSCGNIHKRMNSSRFHTLVSIEREIITTDNDLGVVFCENHPSNEITDVCNDCDKFICTICVSMFHKNHLCKSISAEADEKRNKLKEIINVAENNVTEIEKDMRVVKRQAESKYKYFNEQISELRKTKDSLISKINQKYKACEEKMKQLNDEQLLLSDQMNIAQKITIKNLQKTIEQSKEFLETRKGTLFLMSFDRVYNELSEIKEELAPAVSGKTLMENVERCTTWLVNLDKNVTNYSN